MYLLQLVTVGVTLWQVCVERVVPHEELSQVIDGVEIILALSGLCQTTFRHLHTNSTVRHNKKVSLHGTNLCQEFLYAQY